MRIHFYSPVAFEPWDWRNSIEQGIGGSETSQVEMAWRLARRGHQVTCYAPLPDDCPGEWKGTRWKPLEAADFTEPGLWIIYRSPETLDRLTPAPDRAIWLLWQDWDYPTLTEARAAKVDRQVTLCQWHARYMLRRYPFLAGRVWITSNGVKRDLLETIEREAPIQRDPHKVVFASSPDRGLLRLIPILQRAREWNPALTLDVTYGVDNLSKMPQFKAATDEILAAVEQPWITFHGRISQPDLYRLWQSAGLWVYPTNFHETSCITSMEAQAGGAIPIASPVAALAENVRYGCLIPGNADDPLIRARFAAEIVRFTLTPGLQDSIRPEMQAEARSRFDWERLVDQWEMAARADLHEPGVTRVIPTFPVQLDGGWAPTPRPAPRLRPLNPSISVLTASIRPDRLDYTRATLDAQTLDPNQFEWLVCGPTPTSLADYWLPDPEKRPDDYCTLMRAWNALVQEARGELLIFLSDSTRLIPEALAHCWREYQKNPMLARCGYYIQYQDASQSQITWVDHRLAYLNRVIEPEVMEFRFAAIPTRLVDCVGGFDTHFDRHPAMGEKDLCRRARMHGYAFYLDGELPCPFLTHEPYDKRHDLACRYYEEKHAVVLQ